MICGQFRVHLVQLQEKLESAYIDTVYFFAGFVELGTVHVRITVMFLLRVSALLPIYRAGIRP